MMEENEDKAAELYAMGKQLCEMAKAMGYSEEGEEEDEMGEEETSLRPEQRIPAQAPKGGKSKLDLAIGFLK